MANIHIKQSHNKSAKDLRRTVEKLAVELNRKYQLSSKWNGNTLDFKRSGLHGSLKLGEDEVTINIKLGIMLSTFAGNFKKELTKALKEILA